MIGTSCTCVWTLESALGSETLKDVAVTSSVWTIAVRVHPGQKCADLILGLQTPYLQLPSFTLNTFTLCINANRMFFVQDPQRATNLISHYHRAN